MFSFPITSQLIRSCLRGLGLLTLSCLAQGASAVTAEPVSALVAERFVAQGALVVDVRSAAAFAQGSLPGAVVWMAGAGEVSVQELERHVSRAGIDLSRTVVVLGDAGDPRAQALWQQLAQYASGRVLWLVGGVQEWQMAGFALATTQIAHKPVPQTLVAHHTVSIAPRMAGSNLRADWLTVAR